MNFLLKAKHRGLQLVNKSCNPVLIVSRLGLLLENIKIFNCLILEIGH